MYFKIRDQSILTADKVADALGTIRAEPMDFLDIIREFGKAFQNG
jgi:hypothetical protein